MFYRHFPIALGFLAISVSVHADEPAAYKLTAGPFAVQTVDEITIEDQQRNKIIQAKVYYPEGEGPFPVIVFSHGFAAGKDAFATLGKHWASHGYVSIHPQHADGGAMGRRKKDPTETEQDRSSTKRGTRTRSLDQGKLGERFKSGSFEAGGFQGLGGSPESIADRVRDVSAIIDALNQLEIKIRPLQGKLDREKIGVSGHSFGACVSMLIGGATIEVEGKAKSFADPRVKCVLPISAAGSGEYGLSKNSWKDCKQPALYITGTKDVRPGHEFSWRKEPFSLSPQGDKYLLIVDGATHFHFGGGPEGDGRRVALSSRTTLAVATNMVKTSSTAFFDAYLKGDKKAQHFLSAGLSKYADDKATLTSK